MISCLKSLVNLELTNLPFLLLHICFYYQLLTKYKARPKYVSTQGRQSGSYSFTYHLEEVFIPALISAEVVSRFIDCKRMNNWPDLNKVNVLLA